MLGQRKLVAQGTIAAGDNKLDYTSDNAFIEFGVDISAYHGNHKIVVTDSAGKSVTGYLHSVAPGGETLGDNLISSWTNSGFETFTTNALDITQAIETGVDGRALSENLALGSSGKLTKIGFTLHYTSGSGARFQTGVRSDGSSTNWQIDNIISEGAFLNYQTVPVTSGIYENSLYSAFRVFGAIEFSTTGFYYKQVTDCAATGALIVSTLGGSTRSWTSVDTGFNPNLACDWKIFRV